jgi:hypothetical protein
MTRLTIPLGRTLTADDSIYGVRVIAETARDGSWDTRLEFESRSGIRLSTEARECASRDEVCEWTKRVGEETLRRALARASVGRIERREDREGKQIIGPLRRSMN